MSFENGLTISVQFGVRNYCSARDFDASFGDEKKQTVWESADCEIAIISKKEMWHNFGDDEVKGWVSADEVAEKLGVHETTVRDWINNGRLPAVRLPGGKAIRIRPEDLEEHLTEIEPKSAE